MHLELENSNDVGTEQPRRGVRAWLPGALLVLALAACGDSDEPNDSDSPAAQADDDDDDRASAKKDAGPGKDAGRSAADAGTPRGGGLLDASLGSSGKDSGTAGATKPDAGAPRGGAVTPQGGACTRDSLKAAIDQYFAAMAAHDPTMVTAASDVKFTENAKVIKLGEGIWKTAGKPKFTRSALDTERCGTVTEAVIDNQGMDTIFGLRLKLEGQMLTEVETIVVGSDGFFPTPSGIINSKADAWEELVPEDQRSTREELEAAGKAYFASFADSSVKPPYAMPCDRLENGFKTTQGDCSNIGGAVGLRQPEQRYPVTDVEAGITAGFLLFAGADIDFHMFKVSGGKIRWINAVVGPAVRSSGWDDK